MKTIAVSLKMYFDRPRTLAWLRQVVHASERLGDAEVRIVVLPSTTELDAAVELTRSSRIEIGAQNVAAELSGAYTGEVSARNVAQLGCRVAEVGHAERRRLFAEDDEVVARKSALIAQAGLEPLVCIGEAVAGDARQAASECARQLDGVLDVLPSGAALTVAYEPVWAIGADRPASASHVNDVLGMLRNHLEARSRSATLLYGGSAGPGLLGSLREADGLFLGRFAHDVGQLEAVLQEAAAVS